MLSYYQFLNSSYHYIISIKMFIKIKTLLILGLFYISILIQIACISGETVTLHEHSEFRGVGVKIHFSGCYNLPHDWNDRASSMNTHGMCIRIWEHGGCSGKSSDVKPGTRHHSNLHNLGFGDTISSLSSCGHGSNSNSNSDGGWRQEALDLHNQYRARHGSPPLILSDEVNRSAQKCAEYLASRKVFAHVCKQQTGHSYGENLALRYEDDPRVAAAESTKAFYSEEPKYNYNNPRFESSSGHFTQVVWKRSRRLGLGYAKNGDFKVVVAHYDPHGNVGGQYKENVQRPR